MNALPQIDLRRVRLAGRAPRLALYATCGLMSAAAGARLAADPPAAKTPPTATSLPSTAGEEGLAQRFAAAYLTIKPGADGTRARRLRALGLADDGAPVDSGGRLARRVTATTVAAVDRERGNVVRVTVAVYDGTRWTYLSVPVRRLAGRMSIVGQPAMVGPPATDDNALTAPEDEVTDSGLKQVAARVTRHYLAGDRSDLAADMTAGAVPPLPPDHWRVGSVDATTWVVPLQRVAVLVDARSPGGLRLSLRYELAVQRRAGRWLVSAVFTNPNEQEQSK